MSTLNIGEEGFWWFMGIVENRDDPLKLGRVQVRVHNIHSQKQSIAPTTTLPWAVIIMPPNSASFQKVGISPTGITVGSTVFGFFMDGRSAQNPVVLGTMPGIPGRDETKHDVSWEAREINKASKQIIGPEPASAFKARYPYNKVTRTESGHLIEIDDTPGQERLHIYHKSGTYMEVNFEGRLVTKVIGNNYHVTAKDDELFVGGNANIRVEGNVTMSVGGDMSVDVGGTYSVNAGQHIKMTAPRIDLN